EQADPVSPLLGVQPRWYLTPAHRLLQTVSSPTAALLALAAFLLVFFLPVFSGGSVESVTGRTVRILVGVLVIAAWILLGAREYFF
ncbi:MAG: hypothetical protein ACHQ9S_06675, partial [Candidatus Binatia bacterium]